jgi:hypothetical protein
MVSSVLAAFVAELSLKRLGIENADRAAALFQSTSLLGRSKTSKIANVLRTSSRVTAAGNTPTVKSDRRGTAVGSTTTVARDTMPGDGQR